MIVTSSSRKRWRSWCSRCSWWSKLPHSGIWRATAGRPQPSSCCPEVQHQLSPPPPLPLRPDPDSQDLKENLSEAVSHKLRLLARGLLLSLLFEFLHVRFESLLVLVPDGGHQRGDNLANVGYHGERQRDPDDGKENTKQSAESCHGGKVAITCTGESHWECLQWLILTNGCQNGGGEEDCLDVIPVDIVFLGHDVDAIVGGFLDNELVLA